MKSDRELLKELLEYFEGVMAVVEEGKPFDKVDVPDCSGHELEFKIDMVIDLLHDMMYTYSTMRNLIIRINGTDEGICWPNINEFLEKLEKRMSDNNKKAE